MANCTIQMALNKRSLEVLKESRESHRPIDKLAGGNAPCSFVCFNRGKTCPETSGCMERMKASDCNDNLIKRELAANKNSIASVSNPTNKE
ncbi:hypothetical protein X777_11669 [Ooceraea biroi]|uniref:Uncharacterized protein n=1 Tax=Ooceraea biroi TaxID=2015173 RepID=A0A026W2H4_OOCBI|nr:hypothetical protein X777_11669 [Ooceraea biroi]